MKPTLICVCGPTAVGKTTVAINIAKQYHCPIVSFDSRQFFKELQIGAAPPSLEELAEAPHHFIGQLSINQNYNAGIFEKEAITLLNKLFKEHSVIVAVGGSGMYLQALLNGFDEMPTISNEIRAELQTTFEQHGLAPLQRELEEKDPEHFAVIDLKNPQRVIRALEVIRSTGNKYSGLRKGTKATRNFNALPIGLTLPREELYQRVNLRVDKMVSAGLVAEVKSLVKWESANALQTVGYKELFTHFNGVYDLDTAVEEIKKNSRRYAKRQLTWFKHQIEMPWFNPQNTAAILEYTKTQLPQKA